MCNTVRMLSSRLTLRTVYKKHCLVNSTDKLNKKIGMCTGVRRSMWQRRWIRSDCFLIVVSIISGTSLRFVVRICCLKMWNAIKRNYRGMARLRKQPLMTTYHSRTTYLASTRYSLNNSNVAKTGRKQRG